MGRGTSTMRHRFDESLTTIVKQLMPYLGLFGIAPRSPVSLVFVVQSWL